MTFALFFLAVLDSKLALVYRAAGVKPVRPSEVAIVGIVLCVWASAVYVFINQWGKTFKFIHFRYMILHIILKFKKGQQKVTQSTQSQRESVQVQNFFVNLLKQVDFFQTFIHGWEVKKYLPAFFFFAIFKSFP